MPVSSPTRKELLLLLHNLESSSLEKNKSFDEMLHLLARSDIDSSSFQQLHNESDIVVNKNISLSPSLREKLQSIEQAAKPQYKVFRRETPFISSRIAASSPDWARGARIAHSAGPFKGVDGRLFWFDFYFYEKLIPVYVSGDTAPIMLIPLNISIFQIPKKKFTVPDGSIWLRADMFAAGLNNTQYTGLNISSGEFTLSTAHNIVNDTLTINASETISVNLVLNNNFSQSGTGSEGIDARDSVINLPASCLINFAAGKFSLAQLGESNWKLYDDERNFSLQPGGTTFYNTFLNRLVFALDTDEPSFNAANSQSDFFTIDGKANIISSGWCLPIAVLNIANPFAVSGNGALAILCNDGLHYQWQSLDVLNGDVKMKIPLIMAEPGKFSIADAFSLFKQHNEFYQLWKRSSDADIRTTVTLKFKKDKPFIYYCDQAGFEAITCSADADFQTDKPYKGDSSSVSPNTLDSLYIKYVMPGIRNILLYDADMLLQATPAFNHVEKAEIYQFAIMTAYMVTTPPSSLLLTGGFDDNNIITKGNLTIVYGLFTLTPILPHPYTTNQQLTEFGINASYLKNIKEVSQWLPLLTNYLMSTCIWDDANIVDGNTVTVDFDLLTDIFRALTHQPTGPEVTNQALAQMLQEDLLEEFSLVPVIATDNTYYGRSLFSLLDLSTNYDLFGVNMVWNNRRYESIRNVNISTVSSGVVTIERMNLQAPMALLNTFTLPNVSWEPVNNLAIPDEAGYPPAGILSFKDSGPPTIFSQLDTAVIDIDPVVHLERFKQNLADAAKNKLSYIIFGLPHGKVSLAFLKYFSPEHATVKGNFDFIRPEFIDSGNNITGGLQFRMAASLDNADKRPMIQGVTNQLSNLVHNNANIPESILGGLVHEIFLNDFYRNSSGSGVEVKVDGVPLTHLDFSGYGASTFSDWRNPKAKIAQVSQTRFDILVGRVKHEVVQVVSILYPWGIRVVRTITLYRSGNAIVYREDSGWVAQGEGLFDFYFPLEEPPSTKAIENPFAFYPGLIKGLFNIHNIKELKEPRIKFDYNIAAGEYYFESATKEIKQSPGSKQIHADFAAVTFDADVEMDYISSGATNGRVSGKSFKGYLQVLPQAVPINAIALKMIFDQQQNSVGGAVDCTMKIGGSEQLTKLNRVEMNASYRNNNSGDLIFVVAAKGSVQLPAEGSWSVVEVDKSNGEVAPVNNKQSVPVIRKGERARNKSAFIITGNDNISRVAFGDSLLNTTSFSKRYGYVQNTGSQKLLLTDPKVDQNLPSSLKTEAPLLADTYRLLNSKGPFPNTNNVIPIENVAEALTVILPKGLQKTINNFSVPDNLKFDILGKDGDTLHMYVQYESKPSGGGTSKTLISYVTDSIGANPGDKWKNELNNLSVAVDMGPFKKLLTVSGNMKAKSAADPGFDSGNAPQLVLCKELQPIYEILEFLANLDPTQPVDAIKKGLKIVMSNTADSWEYKFKADKEIPIVKFPFDPINYNSPTTPLKLDAYFKVGCYFNQPIKIPNTVEELMPSAGAFLELGADLRVMCVSLAAATVYATGRAQVGLAADIKSGPNLYFKFGFGIELCVGLPVIGSVSVMYLVGVDMKLTTEALTVGAFLYFRGRAEIFAGIVTITIQIEAAGKIQKQLGDGPTSCIASCTFALDISIFLVINISFTETWTETRQIA